MVQFVVVSARRQCYTGADCCCDWLKVVTCLPQTWTRKGSLLIQKHFQVQAVSLLLMFTCGENLFGLVPHHRSRTWSSVSLCWLRRWISLTETRSLMISLKVRKEFKLSFMKFEPAVISAGFSDGGGVFHTNMRYFSVLREVWDKHTQDSTENPPKKTPKKKTVAVQRSQELPL